MTPEEANALELGQQVRFTQVLYRQTDTPEPTKLTKTWVRWKYLPWATGETGPRPEFREGIVVGLRTLAQGHLEWIGFDEGHAFRRTGSQQAVLVAWHKRRKPELVAPEDLDVVPVDGITADELAVARKGFHAALDACTDPYIAQDMAAAEPLLAEGWS